MMEFLFQKVHSILASQNVWDAIKQYCECHRHDINQNVDDFAILKPVLDYIDQRLNDDARKAALGSSEK